MNSTVKQIAKRRIQILFQQALISFDQDQMLAKNYISAARKIAMAARIRLPPEYSHQICKDCNNLLVIGKNSRVRIRSQREPHVVMTCLNCGKKTRYPMRENKKEQDRIEQNNNQNEAPC